MSKVSNRLWSEGFYEAVNPRVLSAGFHRASGGWEAGPENRLQKDFDLWYVSAGSGSLKVDGRWIKFHRGDLITMKPGQNYQRERADRDDPFEIYFVHVLIFDRSGQRFESTLSRRWPAKIRTEHRPKLGTLFAELFESFTAAGRGFQLQVKSIMLQILDNIFVVLRHGEGTTPPPSYHKFLKARDYIEEQYKDIISLEEIAEYSDLSESYLSAMFRRYLSCSPVRYQIDRRLMAARLLLAKGRSVSDVAAEVGFNSLHYFSRIFKKHVGLPPSEFALLCRSK